MYPKSISDVINDFRKLPGVGEKTAERYALQLLSFEKEDIDKFSKDLISVTTKIKKCKICNNLTEDDICSVCSSESRNASIVCVVEEFKDVMALEKTGSYNGLYHVLGGLISPLDGIGPEDVEIISLTKRIEEGKIKEIILALKPSIEGETTALYIKRVLEGIDVVVSKIANGLPIGADIEYVDALTLERAIQDRRNISE